MKHARQMIFFLFLTSFLVLLNTSFAVGQSYDIYKVDVRSGGVFQITSIQDADEYNPSWSNNGKRIAHDVLGGPAPLGHSIYVTDVSTGVSTLLVGADGGNDAAWSPNGNKIAFDRFPVGDKSIYIVPASGGSATLVVTDAIDAAWSPNSKRLVFQSTSDGSIRTVDENGQNETLVTPSGTNPVWSPNGQWIAFSNGGDIWKIRVDMAGVPQGQPIQVTSGPGWKNQLSWSQNSHTIVFHSDLGGSDFDIWTVPATGGTPTKLTGLPGYGDYDPAYSNNGQYVAYAGYTGESASSRISAEGLTTHFPTSDVPQQFTLGQNYPNPFNPETTIPFELPEAGHVTLKIFNIIGQEVATLVEADLGAGRHTVRWNGMDYRGEAVASGVYLLRLDAGAIAQWKKMTLAR